MDLVKDERDGLARNCDAHNRSGEICNLLNLGCGEEESGLTMHHTGFDTGKANNEMTRVLKPGGWMAIYDEPSTVFYCTRLMRKQGLQIKKKKIDMVFGVKSNSVIST